MVLQGANDPRVLKVESDEIVAAAKKNGVPVEYIVFPDEGHGFVKKPNEIKGYTAVLAFLDKHLKGRSRRLLCPIGGAPDPRSFLCPFAGVVADVARRHDEDHVLGDVGRVVADALQVAGDEDEIEGGLDGRGILQHVGQ